jgi:hypothetical protein
VGKLCGTPNYAVSVRLTVFVFSLYGIMTPRLLSNSMTSDNSILSKQADQNAGDSAYRPNQGTFDFSLKA